jgi:4-hydroxy-tetrahydrodipicolinate reductase
MKIGIIGCAGRMGRTLIAEVAATEGAEFAASCERLGAQEIGADASALAGLAASGIKVGADAKAVFAASDAVIDFTAAVVAPVHAGLAAESGKILVIGTTGLDAQQQKAVEDASKRTVVVQAANFSIGVNLLLGLTKKLGATLGPDYDIDILEMHHRHKVDAPSGTALALGRAAAAGRGVDLDKVSQRSRDGVIGARRKGEIGFAALRGGDVVGDHTVIFAAEGERIELGHKASSRTVFARGAVRAALWAKGKKPGLYSMADVLGLS